VAAQAARDKKKARLDELEIIVEDLKKENQRLTSENERLAAENLRLSATSVNDRIPEDPVLTRKLFPVESAAGTGKHFVVGGHPNSVVASVSQKSGESEWRPSSIRIVQPLDNKESRHCFIKTQVRPSTISATDKSPITQENVDILDWLAKAVLEDQLGDDLSDHKFDLLEYVSSDNDEGSEEDGSKLQKDNVSFEELFEEKSPAASFDSFESLMEDVADNSPRQVDTAEISHNFGPSSPFQSLEILEYFENPFILPAGSVSEMCNEEEMEEPNWLSDWDSV
jgi:hypothetical protein